jgi:hypothetical protein
MGGQIGRWVVVLLLGLGGMSGKHAQAGHIICGAVLGPGDNQIQKTKASGNGNFDLQDDNVNCGTNLWANNTGTKSQGCIN